MLDRQVDDAEGQDFFVEVDGERFPVWTMEPEGRRYSYNYGWLTGPRAAAG